MGASGWSYFVPYQADIKQALRDLRLQVYGEQAYYDELMSKDELWLWLHSEFSKPISEQFGGHRERGIQESMIGMYKPIYERLKLLLEPKTVDDELRLLLVRADAEQSGTHSIIDIEDMGEVGDFRRAGLLSDEQLVEIFDTVKPTREMIEQTDLEEILIREIYMFRGSAVYFVVYKDEMPHEIFFIGLTGD